MGPSGKFCGDFSVLRGIMSKIQYTKRHFFTEAHT